MQAMYDWDKPKSFNFFYDFLQQEAATFLIYINKERTLV